MLSAWVPRSCIVRKPLTCTDRLPASEAFKHNPLKVRWCVETLFACTPFHSAQPPSMKTLLSLDIHRSAIAELQADNLMTGAGSCLQVVRETGQAFSLSHVLEVFKGSRNAAVKRQHHDQLPCHGLGKHLR